MMFTVEQILKATDGRLIAGKRNVSGSGVCSDSRSLSEGDVFIAIRGKNFDGHDFIDEAIKKGARIIIVEHDFRFNITKGLSINDCGRIPFIRVNDTVRALGDIAKFHRRRFDIPVIGVTGSCGKTTTKDMIHAILSTKFNVLKNEGTFNNFIGLPHTLLKLNEHVDIAVVEMGTSGSGQMQRLCEIACPNIGIITNIGPAHLEFFKSLDSVLKEKTQLINNLNSPYLAIINGDDKLLRKKIRNGKNKTVFTFGVNNGSGTFLYAKKKHNKYDFVASDIRLDNTTIQFMLNNKHQFKLNLLGRHNVYNVTAAALCAIVFGVEPGEAKKRLSNFILPLTRINFRKIKNYQIIDDTYNSNPLSLEYAIETLKNFNTSGKKIFVMGDMLELGKRSILLHQKAGEMVIKSGIDILITVGRLSSYTADFARRRDSNLKVYSCACSLEAKGILFNMLKVEDLVLVKGSRAMEMEKIIQDIES